MAEYEELAGSPRIVFRNTESGLMTTVVRRLKCAWADRYAITAGCINSPVVVSGGAFAIESVDIQPLSDGGMSIAPIGGGSDANYEYALVEAVYGTRVTHGGIGSWVAMREMVSTDMTIIDRMTGDLVQATQEGPMAPDYNARVRMMFPTGKYSVRVMRLSSMMPRACLSMLGHVNSAPFNAGVMGVWEAGTVLYAEHSHEDVWFPGEVNIKTYVCTFYMHPRGWNTGFSTAAQAFLPYIHRTTGNPVLFYPMANLNGVLI